MPQRDSSAIGVFWARSVGPVRYGVNDCCVALADVVSAAGGPDLMQVYRGRYRTARGFVRAFHRQGHETLDQAVSASFAEHGRRVQEPTDFDVAMVGYPQGGRMLASPGFFYNGMWHVRSEAGGLVLMHSIFDGSPDLYRII